MSRRGTHAILLTVLSWTIVLGARGSFDGLPEIVESDGAGFHLPLSHQYSSLPGSSFQSRNKKGSLKFSVTPDHHGMLKAHDLRRHRRLAAAQGGGATFQLGGNAERTVAGLYWAPIQLGQDGRVFNLQIDTGSDIVWVNCQPCISCPSSSSLLKLAQPYDRSTSNSSSLVDCTSSTCYRMQSTQSMIPNGCLSLLSPSSTSSTDPACYYELLYGDGSQTYGFLIRDTAQYQKLDGQPGNTPLLFGCGYNQSASLSVDGPLVDGLMGLGQGPLSLLSQLMKNGMTNGVMAHCLGGEQSGGGTLIFGTVLANGVAYTPLVNQQSSQYFVQLNGIAVKGTPLPGIDQSSFGEPTNGGGVILDSGTTLALFPTTVYTAWKNAVLAAVVGLTRSTYREEICFDLSSSSYENLPKHFPNVTLLFDGASMELPPSSYISILSANFGSSLACLAWQDVGSSSLNTAAVIGDIVLRGQLVVYDVDSARIGWAPFDCSSGTIRARDGGSYNVSIVVGAPVPSKSGSRMALLPHSGRLLRPFGSWQHCASFLGSLVATAPSPWLLVISLLHCLSVLLFRS